MNTGLLSPAAEALLAKEQSGETDYAERGLSDLDQLASLYLRSPSDWHRRAAAVRTGMQRGLGLARLASPTVPKAGSKPIFAAPNCEIESYSLEVAPGLCVAGTIYRPTCPGPWPVALLPHGHGEGGRFHANQQRLASTLADLGLLSTTYDMQGYGESDQMPHDWQYMAALQTWQSIRVLDYLLSLPGVDRSRVLVTGHSGGATQSIYLTALDDRVSMSIPVVMVSSAFYGGCLCESGLPVHQGDRDAGGHATNNAEIAALASSTRRQTVRPMLIVSIDGDWTAMTPYREFPYIARVYELLGAKSLVENCHLPESVHDYGAAKRHAAYRFIAKHWGLDIERIVDGSGVVAECGPLLSRSELSFHSSGSARWELGPANASQVLGFLQGMGAYRH
jgi:uncharacterized protein